MSNRRLTLRAVYIDGNEIGIQSYTLIPNSQPAEFEAALQSFSFSFHTLIRPEAKRAIREFCDDGVTSAEDGSP
jgi:hypothetical protein